MEYLGLELRNSETGENIKVVGEKKITITILEVESDWGKHPRATRVIGPSDIERGKWKV
jgi:hypothetical protein